MRSARSVHIQSAVAGTGNDDGNDRVIASYPNGSAISGETGTTLRRAISEHPPEAKSVTGILRVSPCQKAAITLEEASEEVSPINGEISSKKSHRAGISFGSSQVICISDLSDVVAETSVEEDARRHKPETHMSTPSAAQKPPPGTSTTARSSPTKQGLVPPLVLTQQGVSAKEHAQVKSEAILNPSAMPNADNKTSRESPSEFSGGERDLEHIFSQALREVIAWANRRKCKTCHDSTLEQRIRQATCLTNPPQTLIAPSMGSRHSPIVIPPESPRFREKTDGKEPDGRRARFDSSAQGLDSATSRHRLVPQELCENYSKEQTTKDLVPSESESRGRNQTGRLPSKRDQTPFSRHPQLVLEGIESQSSACIDPRATADDSFSASDTPAPVAIGQQQQTRAKFSLADETKTLEFPIESADLPNRNSEVCSTPQPEKERERSRDPEKRRSSKRDQTPFNPTLRFELRGSNIIRENSESLNALEDDGDLCSPSTPREKVVPQQESKDEAGNSSFPVPTERDRGRATTRRKPSKRDQTPFNPPLHRDSNSYNSDDSLNEAVSQDELPQDQLKAERVTRASLGCAKLPDSRLKTSGTLSFNTTIARAPTDPVDKQHTILETSNNTTQSASDRKEEGGLRRNSTDRNRADQNGEDQTHCSSPQRLNNTMGTYVAVAEGHKIIQSVTATQTCLGEDFGMGVSGTKLGTENLSPGEDRGRACTRRKPSKRDQTPFNLVCVKLEGSGSDAMDTKSNSSSKYLNVVRQEQDLENCKVSIPETIASHRSENHVTTREDVQTESEQSGRRHPEDEQTKLKSVQQTREMGRSKESPRAAEPAISLDISHNSTSVSPEVPEGFATESVASLPRTLSDEERGRTSTRRKPSKRDQTPFNPTLHRALSSSDDSIDSRGSPSSQQIGDQSADNFVPRILGCTTNRQAVSFSEVVTNLVCNEADKGDRQITSTGISHPNEQTRFSDVLASNYPDDESQRNINGSEKANNSSTAWIRSPHWNERLDTGEQNAELLFEGGRGRTVSRRKPSKRDQTPFNSTLHRNLSSSDGSTDSRDSPVMRDGFSTGQTDSVALPNSDSVALPNSDSVALPNDAAPLKVSFNTAVIPVPEVELSEERGRLLLRRRPLKRDQTPFRPSLRQEISESDDSGTDEDLESRNDDDEVEGEMRTSPTATPRFVSSEAKIPSIQPENCGDRDSRVKLSIKPTICDQGNAREFDDFRSVHAPPESGTKVENLTVNVSRKKSHDLVILANKSIIQSELSMFHTSDDKCLTDTLDVNSLESQRQLSPRGNRTPVHASSKSASRCLVESDEYKGGQCRSVVEQGAAEPAQGNEAKPQTCKLLSPCELSEQKRGRTSVRRKPSKRDQTPFNPMLFRDESSSVEESESTQEQDQFLSKRTLAISSEIPCANSSAGAAAKHTVKDEMKTELLMGRHKPSVSNVGPSEKHTYSSALRTQDDSSSYSDASSFGIVNNVRLQGALPSVEGAASALDGTSTNTDKSCLSFDHCRGDKANFDTLPPVGLSILNDNCPRRHPDAITGLRIGAISSKTENAVSIESQATVSWSTPEESSCTESGIGIEYASLMKGGNGSAPSNHVKEAQSGIDIRDVVDAVIQTASNNPSQ
jgi:hypothetical protein